MANIRSSQLMAPFGIGQIVNLPNNLSMMIGGLNLWNLAFEDRRQQANLITTRLTFDKSEFQILEPRLSAKLFGKSLYKPFHWKTRGNINLEIPIYGVRFPKWHYCDTCHSMIQLPIMAAPNDNPATCNIPNCEGKMIPVRFIAVCPNGHIEDVPFLRWVHRGDPAPNMTHKLKYIERGGSGDLGDIVIECVCKVKRSLAGITRENALLNIENDLDDHDLIQQPRKSTCRGLKLWTGNEIETHCQENLQVVLRGASNVHFAKLTSSIYIPDGQIARRFADKIINHQTIHFLRNIYNASVVALQATVNNLLIQHDAPAGLNEEVINIILNRLNDLPNPQPITDTEFRYTEYKVFTGINISENEIKTYAVTDFNGYSDNEFLTENFDRVVLVEKMRETIAFTGFTRLRSENNLTPQEKMALLSDKEEDWLPAYVTHGEGIFLEFKGAKIEKWLRYIEEKRRHGHTSKLIDRYQIYRRNFNPATEDRPLDDCFVFMHTFAHILIKRLCYNCGYSAASLKERIYHSKDVNTHMHGVLIYTASSDSSGSLGGLVNQGRSQYLAQNIRQALEDASWCSADPVCMDVGINSGQGPGSANGAACHNCSVIAETSCEEFNLLLDRSTVVGTIDDPQLGFFGFNP